MASMLSSSKKNSTGGMSGGGGYSPGYTGGTGQSNLGYIWPTRSTSSAPSSAPRSTSTGYSPPPMPKPPMPQYQPPPQPQAPMQMNYQAPPAQQYPPTQAKAPTWRPPGEGQLGQSLGQMRGYSEGFMDPDSDYYKRLVEGMEETIGGQTEAKKRAAQLQSVYGGMGAGGAEMMQQQSQLGQAGLEQMGGAAADLRLQAPSMGLQALQSTFSPQLGLQGMQEQSKQFGANQDLNYAQMGEQSRQFGAGLGEQGRQFGVNAGLQAQQQAQNVAMQQWQQQQQYNQMILQMMAGMYG